MRINPLLQRISSIADQPGDSDQLRLRHRILIIAGITMSGGGLLWGWLSFTNGLYYESLIPFAYVFITLTNFTALGYTKNFNQARFIQILASMLLPFAFQWSLGGFQPSGTVMIWAMMALVGSISLEDAGASVRWLILYIVLTVFSGIVDSSLHVPSPLQNNDYLSRLFSSLNMVVVSSLAFGLTAFFVRQRQKALEELALRNQQLAASQQALVQSEKLAALGQLVAGVAHELNTPLGAIQASAANLATAADEIVRKCPHVITRATPGELDALLALLGDSGQTDGLSTSREERTARRELRRQLETHDIDDTATLADMLVDMNISKIREDYLDLLRSSHCNELLQAAFNLISLRRNSRNIDVAATRAANIVFALKSYAHPGAEGAYTRAALADNLDTVLTLYQNQMKNNIERVCRYDEDTVIEARHDQINQVWTNLIHNALQAMNYAGTLTIDVRDLGESVKVTINDNGPGVAESARAHIFEPFYTTKNIGEGTGLGLSICRDIIEQHQGTIACDTQPGNTSFIVTLPKQQNPDHRI